MFSFLKNITAYHKICIKNYRTKTIFAVSSGIRSVTNLLKRLINLLRTW